MNIEQISTLETKKQLPVIPKSKEIYSGDINDAVKAVQETTGFEITPEWWLEHVGNDGSTEEILERFDSAFEKFVREQIIGGSIDTQEDFTYTREQIIREADDEYVAFNARLKDDPEYSRLSAEFVEDLRAHLMNKYFSGETAHDNERELAFGVEIEVSDEYGDKEREQLTTAAKEALRFVDKYLDGKVDDIFSGLSIRIGENVAQGGGEAIPDKNLITLNGRPLLMSISEMRDVAGYHAEELTGGSLDEHAKDGALKYTLVHEMGHILDERTETGSKRHRVVAAESPTEYGRKADEWNTEKDHEAFAEGFAHMVYGMPVSEALAQAINETIAAKFAEG